VEYKLRCPLDKQVLSQPVTLPCGHTFSKHALELYFDQSFRGEHKDEQPPQQRRCPKHNCRRAVPQGPLQVNRALQENLMR
jgi:hypothetical protein